MNSGPAVSGFALSSLYYIAMRVQTYAIFFVVSLAPQMHAAEDLSVIFAGSGLNDASAGEASPLQGIGNYVVTISETSAPDTFVWNLNNGQRSSPAAITGAPQMLSNGVWMQFSATTGHRTGDSWVITAAPGVTAVGAGAISRSIREKARDFVNVKDFGAVCNGGATDDRAAIQSAIDAVGSGTVWLPNGPACGVGSPGLYLYPSNIGITVHCQARSVNPNYVPGTAGCLVAYRSTPPATLLTNMAERSHLENLYLDGNAGVAAHGLIDVNADRDIEQDVTAEHFSGSGMQVWNEGTPATTLTHPVMAGSSRFEVAAITTNRITFGKDFCDSITLDYGTPSQESLALSSVSGTTLTTRTATRADHSANSGIRCHGHDNELQINHYESFGNGGWGFEIIPSSDNNGISWSDGNSNGNALGGEKWFGSVHMHYGGNYEADRGPAIQMGEASAVPGTAGMYIGPAADMEESNPEFDAVWSVCDNMSRVDTQGPARLLVKKGKEACATYPLGSTTSGLQVSTDQNGSASVFIVGANGEVPIAVYRENASGRCQYPGEIAINPNGTSMASTYQYCIGNQAERITSGDNASPVVLTASQSPASGYVTLSGFTAEWASLNGNWRATRISDRQFSVPVDSRALGALSGTPTVSTSTWTNAAGASQSTVGRTTTIPGVPTNCTFESGTPTKCTEMTLTFINGILQ